MFWIQSFGGTFKALQRSNLVQKFFELHAREKLESAYSSMLKYSKITVWYCNLVHSVSSICHVA